MLLASAAAGFRLQASEAAFKPIALSGWNADVVFECGPSTSAESFDRPGQRSSDYPLYAWFESGLEGHADGLPASRRFASLANTNVLYEFQPYSTNNVLLLTSAKPAGKLVLLEKSAYRCLWVLAAAGGGESASSLLLHFADGTDSEAIPCPVPDWWSGSESRLTKTAAITRLGRSNGQQGFSYEEYGDDGFALYQTKIELTVLKLDGKAIQSITFTKFRGAATVGIFAVSGERASTSGPNADSKP